MRGDTQELIARARLRQWRELAGTRRSQFTDARAVRFVIVDFEEVLTLTQRAQLVAGAPIDIPALDATATANIVCCLVNCR